MHKKNLGLCAKVDRLHDANMSSEDNQKYVKLLEDSKKNIDIALG